MLPLVEYWGNAFKNRASKNLINGDFMQAGFMHFEPAVRMYYERLKKGKVGFKFSSYFEWFIRQGFVDYIKNNSEDE